MSGSQDPELSHDEGYAGRKIARKLEHELAPVVSDPAKRGKVIEQVVAVIEQEDYRGPLPHPAHFAEFEKALPGAGAKIIKMADAARSRADDRYDLIVKNDHQYRVLGMWLAAGILGVCLIAGTVLCVMGHSVVGGALLAASGLTAIASRFIDGKK